MSRTTPELENEIVRAGAGAGKTTKLTAKVLEVASVYFKEHKRAPKIVVTTFTRKATEELRERLVRQSCKLGEPELIDFVTSRGNLHISTIHGVLSLFLRRYGHIINFDAGFSILEPQMVSRQSRKVLRDILIKNLRFESLLEHYTFDQLAEAVRDFSDATCEHGVLSPYSEDDLIKIIDKEVSDIASSLISVSSRILQEVSNPKWIEYCHHLRSCAELLVNKTIANPGEWIDRLEAASKPRYMSKSAPFSDGLHDELKSILSRCDNLSQEEFNLSNVKIFSQSSIDFFELASLYSLQYSDLKQKNGQLEMKDLEFISMKAVSDFPEVAAAFSSEWDYWLIDEFQDTSPSQVELLHQLIGSKPVFLVGDPQQSIYLFRGARSEVFAAEEKVMRERGGLFSELKKNYRSRPELLLFFNDFFKQFDQDFLEMEPRDTPKGLANATDTPVARIQIVSKDAAEPYDPLVQQIISRVSSGAKYEDFCVLTRTNNELKELAQYFESRNLPTHLHSSDGFFLRREILDVMSLLKFILNPLDNLNFIRLVRSPWLKIEDQLLAKGLANKTEHYWPHFEGELSQHATILKLKEILQGQNKLGVFETLRNSIIKLGLIDAAHFHDPTGRRESNIWKFLALIREREKTPGFSYMNFVQKALMGYKSAEGDEETDAVAALEPNRINLMTIHKAKGLKFKHVLIPNLQKRLITSEARSHESSFVCAEDERKFTIALKLGEERKTTHNLAAQNIFNKISEREREEFIRVLYVAMTRAEETVTLHWREPVHKGSWASLLRFNLDDGLHTTDKYSYFVQRDFSEKISHQEDGVLQVTPRQPWSLDHSEFFTHQRLSVSRLVEERLGSLDSNSESLLKPKNLKKHLEVPVLGQKLHTLLERMKYQDGVDVKAYAQRWFADRSTDFIQAVDYVLNLEDPPIRKIIATGEVEWGFQILTARGVLEGQIDLWGTVVDEQTNKMVTWVIDYKSGSSRYSAKAFEQLKLYAYALRSFGIEHEIRLAVIYVVENKLEVKNYLDIEI